MRVKVIISSLLFLAVFFNCFSQTEPPVGKRWIVVPELTDEFEGTELNTEKWTH